MSEFAQVRVRNAIDPPCPKHPAVQATYVCLESGCQESLACHECIIDGGAHSRHKLTMLTKHLDVFKKMINEFNISTRKDTLTPLKTKVEQIAEDLEAFDPATTALLEQIEAKGEKIHNQTSAVITGLKTKCLEIRTSDRQVLDQYQRDLLAEVTEVEADISELDNVLSSDCKADIVNAAKTGISKTYPCMAYPMGGMQNVSFNESNVPVKDIVKLIGKVRIGNEQPEWEETDDEKIKRMEAHITDLSEKVTDDQATIQQLQDELKKSSKRVTDDQATIQQLQDELKKSVKRVTDDQATIQQLQDELKKSSKRMEADKVCIRSLQTKSDVLAMELRDQTRTSEKRIKELEQKIEHLENPPCSVCRNPKKTCSCCKVCGNSKETCTCCKVCGKSKGICTCITCPICSHKDHKDKFPLWVSSVRVRDGRPPPPYGCPQCGHEFY